MGRGLSPQQLGILHRLGSGGSHPITMDATCTPEGHLIDRHDEEARATLNREAASTSRTLRRLRERGLVERCRHYYKGSKSYGIGWRLTARGKELMVKLRIPELTDSTI